MATRDGVGLLRDFWSDGIYTSRVGTEIPLSSSSATIIQDRKALLITLGVGKLTYYVKRARDMGVGPPSVFIEWISEDRFSSPPVPPSVGPWGEIKIVAVKEGS